MKRLAYVFFTSFLLLASSCIGELQPEQTGDEECFFDLRRYCGGGFSFSIVNRATYENLAGEGRLIDPEKVVFINTREDRL
ncbi:MAG: hypothetical protein AAF789_04310 [Bacteroidota bacterium]